MKVFYTSNIGRKKSNNEDSLLINKKIISESSFDLVLKEEILNEEFYLAIADGMGGYEFGEVASKSILEFLLKYDMTDVEVTSNILKNIQKDLYKLSFYHKKYSGMGSVLSGIKVLEKSIIVFNVGDSRTYRVHNGKVNFVTEDDSYVYTLYKKGILSYDEMRKHPNNNVVTSCYRAVKGELLDFEVRDFEKFIGDRYFICSDGLWEMIETDFLNQLISSENIEINLNNLLKMSIENGGKDNISFILIEI